jgi:hypothetical protein
MEKYKRAFIRHHKLIYEQREKRFVHNYINSDLNGERRQKTLKRLKRALKGGSSSRAFGTSHKSSNSQLSLRRNNKKNQYYEEEEKQEQEVKKPKHKFRGPCDPLSSEPYVNVEIVKHGRDPNVSFSSGTIVKMACGKGYGLNMPENKTAKCVRGRWRPTKPTCSICKTPPAIFCRSAFIYFVAVPCFVPFTENGIFKLSKVELLPNTTTDPDEPLNETVAVANGQVVEFSCVEGYNIQGPSNLRCWHGDWTVTSLPECTASPCQLPPISNGQYLMGYRAGLTIANGSSVTFQCDSDYSQSTVQPIQCILGELYPRVPSCKPETGVEVNTKAAIDSPHFIGGADIIKGGDITVLQYGSPSKACGPPAK